MELNQFLLSLLHALSKLDFVERVEFQSEVFILKGRAILARNRFLQVYFNELTGTTAFALIENEDRIWGIDYDNLRGWHLHTLGNPHFHQDTAPMTIEEIISSLSEAWSKLP